MAGTTITSSTTIGIDLTLTSQNPVFIATTGTVAVSGTNAGAIYAAQGVVGTITNNGKLTASHGYGVRLLSGGTITNGAASVTSASIVGEAYGIKLGVHGTGKIVNFGTIANTSTGTGMGVFALGSATVSNGSATDTSASISGYYSGVRISGTAASVVNFGKISASSTLGSGVYLRAGGSVTNGGATDTVASIGGVEFGILIAHAPGTVVNFGTVAGTGTVFARGIVLSAGGSVINGSNSDKSAYIVSDNRSGVYFGGTVAGTLANFGTIRALGSIGKASAVSMLPGGTVTNGSASDTSATIIGERNGVYIRGELASAVVNFGTIQGIGNGGLSLYLGANVTNGSTADTVARIIGVTGIYQGGAKTISNFATISGSGTAIVLGKGGKLANGSATDTVAQVIGGTGVAGNVAAATIANYGSIIGTNGSAIILNAGGTVTNGSATHQTGRISGTNVGITGNATAATVVNFATIAGNSLGIGLGAGGAVTNGSGADTTALINGGGGVSIGGAPGTVVSFGTITGSFNSGINLTFGGSVTNGSASDKTALISGTNGVNATGRSSTVVNFGTINAFSNNGVGLTFGGALTNGSATDTVASISGLNAGVVFGIHGTVAGTLANFGTILCTDTTIGTASFAGVFAGGDATIVNGAANSTVALIGGYYAGVQIRGAAATITNFGTVTASGTGGVGAYLSNGGIVTNGGPTNKSAAILSANIGVQAAHRTGTVVNFGTIKGNGTLGRGVVLSVGGSVTNGSSADTSAYIGANSRNAVYLGGDVADTIVNFGTIKATGPASSSSGISVRGGGSITNGSTADTKALIIGSNHGIYISGIVASTVTNFGTIASSGGKSAITMYLGGHLINGSATDVTARISGASGAYLGGPSTVTNFGTMTGTAGSAVSLRGNSTVINGSAADKTATLNVVGNNGTHSAVYGTGVTTITNFGTIISSTSSAIHLNTGGTIVNGSTADTTALIKGATGHAGIYFGTGQASVTNFGTITGGSGLTFTNGTISATATVVNAGLISNLTGAAGTAISFGAGNDRLVVDPGGSFVGTVSGGGGSNVLELATGTGSIESIGSKFTNFGSVVIDAGGNWTATGTNAAGTVTNNGTLDIGASATFHVTAAVNPISTGIFELNSASVLEVLADTGANNQMKFLGAGEVVIDHAASFGINVGSTAYVGPLIENFGTADKIDLADVASSGAVLNYSTTTGLLQVTVGGAGVATLAFDKASLGGSTFHAGADATNHLLLTRV